MVRQRPSTTMGMKSNISFRSYLFIVTNKFLRLYVIQYQYFHLNKTVKTYNLTIILPIVPKCDAKLIFFVKDSSKQSTPFTTCICRKFNWSCSNPGNGISMISHCIIRYFPHDSHCIRDDTGNITLQKVQTINYDRSSIN